MTPRIVLGSELHWSFRTRQARVHKKGGEFRRVRVLPSFGAPRRALSAMAMMPGLVPLDQISPLVAGITILALSIGYWVSSYLSDWFHKLDRGVGDSPPVSYLDDPASLQKLPCPSVFEAAEKYVSLVIPAYNEQDRLPLTLDETLRYLKGRAAVDQNFTYEIIIVDDGSKDATVKVTNEYINKHGIDKVRLIKQGVNRGKGAAVTKGVMSSRGELILMLDADGATKITDLEKLEDGIFKLLEAQKASDLSTTPLVACGSRAHLEKMALARRKWYRNLLTKGFHLFVLLAAGTKIRDTQCGFKMFTRAAAQQLFINLRLRRWCFDVELLYLCQQLGIPVLEIAVNWTEIPGSKVGVTSILHMCIELCLIRIGYGLRFWRIHRSLRMSTSS